MTAVMRLPESIPGAAVLYHNKSTMSNTREELNMSVQTAGAAKPGRGGRALIDFKKNWQYLLLCLPSMIGYVFFRFVPLAGIIMLFTKYTYRDGIFGSKWV